MLLLLAGATSASKECRLKDIGRRLPWAPGWSFKLNDCTHLSLSSNGLGDGGVKVLAAALAAGGGAPNVVEVNLVNNGIGDEGCVALADALSSPGSGLATLYLERNAIGDRGAIALGAALERNTALETLGLLGNELTDAGRAALQKARFAGSGLSIPGAEDEYQRLGSNGPARVSAQQQQQQQRQQQQQLGRLTDKAVAAAARPPPPAPHPPPQAAPPACRAMCGRATCLEMQRIGQHCEEVALLCGTACAGCCTATSPPAPPPLPPALPPCVDTVEGCSDDSRGVCAAAPSLASRICRATCGVCKGYSAPPEEAGGGWWLLPDQPAATVRGSAGAVSAQALPSAALVLAAAALPLLVAARVAARRRVGVARLESLH
mmetsp:Transcript_21197/g.67510  ORF Transcript_21197/g.67510 Transcript_21197/m.67510 type:complete len:377 (-) Transcript_21197:185-1315(-)